MKYAGLLALCLALSFSGIYAVARQKKKAEILSKIALFFSEFSNIVYLFGFDAVKAIEKISAMEQFSVLPFLKTMLDEYYYGCNIKDIWLNAIDNSDEILLLDRASKHTLCAFADVLGRNSLEGFASRCKDFSATFETFRQKEEKQMERIGTLLIYSGLLAAAALFVVLI